METTTETTTQSKINDEGREEDLTKSVIVSVLNSNVLAQIGNESECSVSEEINQQNSESSDVEDVEIVTKDINLYNNSISTLLPIERVNQSFDLSKLNNTEKKLRETLLDDLEKAQFHTVSALYHYVKIGLQLIEIQELRKDQKGSLKRIVDSVGLNERTAYRYINIAKDERFAKMTEEQFNSLHHLTQSKMITMTKFEDNEFYEAISNEYYKFPPKEVKNKQKPSDYSISDKTFNNLMKYDKTYVIKKYDDLFKEYNDLSKKFDVLYDKVNGVDEDNKVDEDREVA